jgi:DNA-binding transcriptional ArsR family regulator
VQLADHHATSAPARAGGLVAVEKAGRERRYRLDAQRLHKVAGDWLAWFSAKVIR